MHKRRATISTIVSESHFERRKSYTERRFGLATNFLFTLCTRMRGVHEWSRDTRFQSCSADGDRS